MRAHNGSSGQDRVSAQLYVQMARMMLTSDDSVTDLMLRIDCVGGSVYVHSHLLTECSEEWKERLQGLYDIDAGLMTLDTTAWRNPEGGKRRWELYIGFVYGGPIWTRSEEHSLEDDFLQLAIIWDECRYNDQHPDACDAAIDAMCEIATQNADALQNPFGVMLKADTYDECDDPMRLVLDFMVYGRSENVFERWYNAAPDSLASRIDRELAERFEKKGQLRRTQHAMPDLMEPCRYHLHRGSGEHECYLEL